MVKQDKSRKTKDVVKSKASVSKISTHKNSEGVRSVHLVGKVFVTKEEHHYIKKISKTSSSKFS